MRRLAVSVSLLTLVALGVPADAAEPTPAFPGAEGFGRLARGGRGGRVIEVTNLRPDGPGSLKAAVDAKGPRIVVFRVGGAIRMKGGRLSIREPFITIAGQTAPGDGVCLAGVMVGVHTHDVVLRYLRVRTGDPPDGADPDNRDSIDISGPAERVYNVMIDHCSFCWSIDENVTTWYGPRAVTIQWCISSESLQDSLHPKGPHGKGMLLGSQDNTVTAHHCLLAHNMDRNALIGDAGKGLNKGPSTFDFRNNVIYNHGPWACTALRGTSRLNYVGNTIRMGPDGNPKSPRVLRFDAKADQRIHMTGNVWQGPKRQADASEIMGKGRPPKRLCSATPIPAPPVATQSAADAYEAVLAHAGASLPVRDAIDARVVQEVRTRTGRIIDSQTEVGGWPKYRSGKAPADTDHDGMPDAWERQHSLDPRDPADGPADADGDGYTNVEEYLNRTDPTKPTAHTPQAHPAVVVQPGNDALRFGQARQVKPEQFPTPAPAAAFVRAVKTSGKDAGALLGMTFVRVSKGEFMKGKTRVVLTKPFEMAAREVTQAQWVRVMGTRPWRGRPYARDEANHAVSYVSWSDCQEFVKRLGAADGRVYRLPTQAEWEYACRAGDTSKHGFAFTEKQTDAHAWFFGNTVRKGQPFAHPVGRKRPNAWGLFDMVGNVYEWCRDCYDYWYWHPKRCPQERVDPKGAKPGVYYREFRILKGGSFLRRANQLRGYTTTRHRPEYRNFDAGFRVVRDTP